MSKFKIKLKITGFELEVEGSREDVAILSQSVAGQMAGMLQPGALILDAKANEVLDEPKDAGLKQIERKAKRRRASGAAAGGVAAESKEVTFRHDVQKYGNPSQSWKTSSKSIWLLYVLQKESNSSSFSTKSIVDTFNRHFKQSGTITTSNVTRDLGRLKVNEKPSPIGEDSSKSPSEWFLTHDGVRRAEELVKEATTA